MQEPLNNRHSITVASFKVSGWKAVLLGLVLVAGWIGYRLFLQQNVDNPKVLQEIKLHLASEIVGDRYQDMDQIRAALDRNDSTSAAAHAQDLLSRKVQIDHLVAHGAGDDIVVRAEYSVLGPDNSRVPKVGYYRFSHSPITGWRFRRETTALSYYLRL